ADAVAAPLAAARVQRIHGDLHWGNILWATDGPILIDFDDCLVGPPVQDLWLLARGDSEEARRAREDLLEGYELFREFDRSTLALGGRVREHSHGDQIELQICFRGRGWVVVDGVSHPLVPGTVCFLGYDVKHEIINEGPDELVMLWLVSPPGLEDFFKAIGRP